MSKHKTLSELTESELLAELTRRRSNPSNFDVSQFEDDSEEFTQSVKQAFLDNRITDLGEEDDKAKACPRCGLKTKVRRYAVKREIQTLTGKLIIKRNYHYCENCQSGFYPRDKELGLPEKGDVSYGLERRILDFGINDTYAQAAERWGVHYGFAISENLIRRVVHRVGQKVDKCDERYLQHMLMPPEAKASKLLLVQTDGSMLPTRNGWKEAKMAVVMRTENHHQGNKNSRGMVSAARYVGVLGEQEEFSKSLERTLTVERAAKAHRIVWLADGALGNWRLASDLAPGCTQILDWYHAVEHAMDCGKILIGANDDYLLQLWKERCEQYLIQGDIKKIITELMDCLENADTDSVSAINDLVRYYRNNEKRMNYSRYLADGLPIGSGTVESAHRHVLQVRMKRAGQRWSYRRGRQMTRLRAAYRTAGIQRLHYAIRVAAEATRVAPIPKLVKRRASRY